MTLSESIHQGGLIYGISENDNRMLRGYHVTNTMTNNCNVTPLRVNSRHIFLYDKYNGTDNHLTRYKPIEPIERHDNSQILCQLDFMMKDALIWPNKGGATELFGKKT
jgi:hypothetical protein